MSRRHVPYSPLHGRCRLLLVLGWRTTDVFVVRPGVTRTYVLYPLVVCFTNRRNDSIPFLANETYIVSESIWAFLSLVVFVLCDVQVYKLITSPCSI